MITFASILFLLIFASVAWRSREWGVYSVMACLPLYLVRFSVGPLPTTILEGMIGVLFCVWLFHGGARELQIFITNAPRVTRFLFVGLDVFLISSAIGIFVSPDRIAALGIWRAYFLEPTLFFCVLLTAIKTEKHVMRVLWASVLSTIPIIAYAVIQKYTGWNIPDPWIAERRVTSFYLYPNAVGLYLAPIIIFASGILFWIQRNGASGVKKNLQKIILMSAIALGLLSIYFAKTEAAYIALAVAAIFGGFFWSRVSRMVSIGMLAIGIVALSLSPQILSSAKEKVFLNDWSGRVRKITWSETIPMLRDHWLFGAGIAGYQKTMEPYHKAKYIEIFLFPHSFLLNFWTETGLLGLIGMLWVIGCQLFLCVRLFWEKESSRRLMGMTLACAMLAIIIHGLVDVPYFKNDLSVFFWVLLALTIVTYQQSSINTRAT